MRIAWKEKPNHPFSSRSASSECQKRDGSLARVFALLEFCCLERQLSGCSNPDFRCGSGRAPVRFSFLCRALKRQYRGFRKLRNAAADAGEVNLPMAEKAALLQTLERFQNAVCARTHSDRRAIAPGEDPVLSMTKRARAPKLLLHFDTRRIRAQRRLWAQSPRATASAGDRLPAYCAAGWLPVEVAESRWVSVSSK